MIKGTGELMNSPVTDIYDALGIGSQRRQQEFNSAEAMKQRNWETNMSNTAHQREIADLKAAGLNPTLSATGGAGASTPSGANASSGIQGASLMQGLASAINSAASLTNNKNLNKNQSLSKSLYKDSEKLMNSAVNLAKLMITRKNT